MFCDLHTHSTASDGTAAPQELAKLALEAGLDAIALTDHDTTEGLPACARACKTAGVDFVPGVELSADPFVPSPTHESKGRDPKHRTRRGTLHILGLFVQHDHPDLRRIHNRMRAARDSRNPAITAKLKQLGVDIRYEQVLDVARRQGTKIIGRPHIAQLLIEQGYVKSVQEAFSKYLGQGQAAYVRRDRLPATDAINAIHHAGGLAILAHPVQLGLRDFGELEQFVRRLKALGLDGIETHHSDHNPAQLQQYRCLADKLDLLSSGGSDFHGSRKPVAIGSQQVPMEIHDGLRKTWKARISPSSCAC